MNIGRDVLLLLGGAVGLVIALTVVGGGSLSLGTSSAGPFLSFGYSGPYKR